MATVELEDGEWQAVITALAMSNPIVVKIAQQLQRQQASPLQTRQETERLNSGAGNMPS